MIIIAQDKSLVNMDRVSYIGINSTTHPKFSQCTDKLILKYEIVAEDGDKYYSIGTYDTPEEAKRYIKLISQGIEERWNTCEVS